MKQTAGSALLRQESQVALSYYSNLISVNMELELSLIDFYNLNT